MKKITLILFTILLASAQVKADSKEITVLDGSVVMEMNIGGDFPCIGIHFSDHNINCGRGTYLEIKRDGDFYLIKVKYDPEKFRTIDKGIEVYLKDLFKRFYADKNRKHGKKVWSAFVKEGGLQLFIDTAKEWIDDEFLDTPFNEIYG